MDVRSAVDLPDFRLWLIEAWGSSAGGGGAFAPLVEVSWQLVDQTPLEPEVELSGLVRAALWWVEPEMCRLIDRASRTLPPTTLNEDLPIDEHGLVVFAEPLIGESVDETGPVAVSAIGWTRGQLREDESDALMLTSYGHGSPAVQALNLPWAPLGGTSWRYGDDTDADIVFDDPRWNAGRRHDPAALASMAEDRRWFAALHLLAAQPLAESTVQRSPRAVARRSARDGHASDVRIVNLRSRPRTAASGERELSGERREHDHRWIVGGKDGGFWRQQACGPQWSERRPVWIDPYIAGPPDKPLIVRETVKVLRDD